VAEAAVNFTWLYVAVLYAIAVALANRSAERRGQSADEGSPSALRPPPSTPWRVAALFYALTLAFLFRPMTGPYNNVAPDILKAVPPWKVAGFDKYSVSNFELQDVMFQLAPWAEQVHDQWRALHVPLWNDLAGCGMPLLANMQSAALSPLRLFTIPLPLTYALTAEAAMKILIALTFTFLYCRRRYDEGPSIIGAIAFGFGTFILSWLHYPIGASAAFLPAVLYAIDLLAEQWTFARFVFAAALGPLLLSQGHPESVAHIAFIATAYALATAPRAWKRLAAAAIVSALLAAPILAPLVEALPLTERYQDLQRTSHRDGTAFSDFPSLALLVHPRMYGVHPGVFWGPAVTEAVSGFCGILGIGAWFGMLARWRRNNRYEIFYLVASAILFLWLADTPIISTPLRDLFSIALNARLRLPFSFFLAIQSAALVHYARSETRPMIVAVVAAAATLAYVMLRTHFPDPGERHFALVTLIPSVAVLVVAALFRKRPFVIALAVYVELFATSAAWNPVQRGTELYPRTPMIDALLKLQTQEPYRIAGIGAPLFPNLNVPFGLADVRAHDPMASGRYMRLLRTTRNWDAKAYYEKWNDADSPLLDFLNARWILAEPGVDLARFRLVYDGKDGRIFENAHAMPRFFSHDANVAITKWRGDSYGLRVNAPREAEVASSVAWWPGWRVTYNGHSLKPRIVYGSFLGFTIPPGAGTVRVRFVPVSFWGGVAVSLLTIGVLAIMRRRV
jgi:membrane protein YfhO